MSDLFPRYYVVLKEMYSCGDTWDVELSTPEEILKELDDNPLNIQIVKQTGYWQTELRYSQREKKIRQLRQHEENGQLVNTLDSDGLPIIDSRFVPIPFDEDEKFGNYLDEFLAEKTNEGLEILGIEYNPEALKSSWDKNLILYGSKKLCVIAIENTEQLVWLFEQCDVRTNSADYRTDDTYSEWMKQVKFV